MGFLFLDAPTGAETTGIAYDSVTKLGTSIDPATYTPARFDIDFQAALTQIASGTIAGSENRGRGTAIRSYITPTKQRTDYPESKTAAIVDCDARTITILDLTAKTYIIRSFDAPFPEFSEAASLGDGSPALANRAYSLTIATRALGTKRIEGIDAPGYEVVSRFMSTPPGGTAGIGSTGVTTRYYSKASIPRSKCPKFQVEGDGRQFYLWHSSSLLSSRYDSRYENARNPNITSAGPKLPDRLPLLELIRLAYNVSSVTTPPTGYVVSEDGHIRAILSSDPIFKIPPDFKPAYSGAATATVARAAKPATAGIAYDTLTKSTVAVAVELNAFTAAAFDADFHAAAQPLPPAFEHVTHTYLAATKQRTDVLDKKYASILDCETRTVTALDLAKRTYSVKSLESVAAEFAPFIAQATNDVSLRASLNNRSLGTRRVGGLVTPSYETTLTQTLKTLPSPPAPSFSAKMETVATRYYSNINTPRLTCPGSFRDSAPIVLSPELALASAVILEPNFDGAAEQAGGEPRGVRLPDRLASLIVVRITGELPGGVPGNHNVFVIEVGHIRPISSDDPIFAIPPDFKPL